jgi:L-aspartate oxidase
MIGDSMTIQTVPETTETDFLLIGGGVAGLYAAYCAAQRGTVALITKSALTESNSAWAQGGIAAAVSTDDSPELHLKDTLTAGRNLCHEKAVEILTREGPERVREVEALGANFDRKEGAYDLGREGGHSRRRILHSEGSATGGHLVNVLTRRVRESSSIRVFEHTAALELLSKDRRCFGVLARDLSSGADRLFLAPQTILATGGAAGLFLRTTNPPTATGEGIGLAYQAGAEVMDMEFMQFHPTALYSEGGRSFLISEAVRGEGAHLLNAAGERFMLRYHEMGELAPRDVVAAAINSEMKAANKQWVFLSLEHLGGDFVRRRFPNIYEECLKQGIDITRDRVPVAPAAHYTIGGVRTDLEGHTSMEGLRACGEVAATGVHGANRLASNSLLECLVFGKRAVECAGGKKVSRSDWPARSEHRERSAVENADVWRRLGELLTNRVGLVRDQTGLCSAKRELDSLQSAGREMSLDASNRLTVASLMVQAALLRTESRGVHLREDFPHENPEWRKHIVLQRGREPRFVEL